MTSESKDNWIYAAKAIYGDILVKLFTEINR